MFVEKIKMFRTNLLKIIALASVFILLGEKNDNSRQHKRSSVATEWQVTGDRMVILF